MTTLFVPAFKGLVEITAPHRLEPTQATDAVNTRIESGDLVPYKMPALTVGTGTAATGTHSIFKYSDTRWVRWNTAVNVARMPATDSYGRIYYTGDAAPKVTDSGLIGVTNGGLVAASRPVGIPAPYRFIASASGAVGSGTISSIYFWVNRLTSQSKAVVTTSAAHGLSNNHTVVMNFPGVPAGSVYRVQVLSATTFIAVGLKIKQATVVRGVREASADVTIRAPGHGFNTGDKVRLKAAFTGDLATYGDGAETYTIEVVDGNKFTLVDTSGSAITAQDIDGGDCIQVVDVTNPLQYNGGDPAVSWVAPEWQLVANGVYADGRPDLNTWYRSDIQSLLQTRYYCATFVNVYGQEGPPSTPVLVSDINPGVTTVSMAWDNDPANPNCGRRGSGAAVSGADLVNSWGVVYTRLYRTDSAGNWRYVTQLAFSAEGYDDLLLDSALGEVLSTTGYIDPPDTLAGLITTPWGSMVGYSDKTVLASVPYQPHAWPLAYRVQADYPIRGLVNTMAGVIVMTDGYPYLLVGTDPASWEMVKLEIPQSCVSSQSVVDMGEWGLYAGPDGLVAISQNDAKVATAMLFNRAQWQTRTPASLIGAFYEGKYFGVAPTGPFLFDPATGDFVRLDFGMTVMALYADLITDTLYFLAADGNIYAFDRGAANLGMTWVSKLFQLSRPESMTAAQAVVEGQTWVFIEADGTEIHQQAVTNSTPFRLPRVRALDWQIRLAGENRVRQVVVASSIQELKQV